MNQLSDIQPQDYALLSEEDFNLIRDTTKGLYVEVGTFHGASAYAASQNADSVYTIDIYDWQPKVWKNNEKVNFFKGTSVDFIEVILLAQHGRRMVDVIFIDGSHEYDYVSKDIESLVPLVKKGGIILFDDYVKDSTGVYPAVNDYLRESGAKVIIPISKNCNILGVEKP